MNKKQAIDSGQFSGDTSKPFFNYGKWLFGLTLLALVLRVIGLNSGLWLDEIYSVVNQFRLPPNQLFITYISDNQHPLYALFASMSVSIFGEHPWVIRLPAMIFGVASVPALYLLGTRVASRQEALFAAALLTVSYHHIWFSQNARGYSAIALTAILCTDRLLCLLSDRQHRDIWLYGIIAALGCYAHLTMVFIVVAQFIVFLLWLCFLREPGVRKVSWQKPMMAFVLSGFLTLLLYAPILMQVIDYFVNQTSDMVGLSTHAWALAEAFRSLSMGLGGSVIVLAAGMVTLVGLGSYYQSNKMALSIFICSIVVTFLVAFLARGTMYPRFFFFLVGFLILIGVRGVMVTVRFCSVWLFRREEQKNYANRLASAAMIVVLCISAVSMVRNYLYPKMDFEGARQWVESQAEPGDAIVTAGAAAFPYRDFYGVNWPEMKVLSDFDNVKTQTGQIWIVFTFRRYMKMSAPEIYTVVDRECSEGKHFHGTLGGGDMIVCRLPLS